MHRQPRDDRINSPRLKMPSRSSSLGSDRGRPSRISILQPTPIVSPPPAFVALSAASQAATDAQAARFDDEAGDDAASIASADRQQALFTPGALAMINAFLDQILYTSLATAKGTTLAVIRPATEQVLRGKLAREAFASTEEELEDLLMGADEEEGEELDPKASSRPFDLDLAWKRTRLRVMVYTRLGEMEDDDEEHFIQQGKLDEPIGPSKSRPDDAGLISWAAAIFMTSILEYIAEQCIFIAASAAFDRTNSRAQGAESPVSPNGESGNHVKILEHDVEKIALNPTLNRLWRTWRKGLRQSRSLALTPGSTPRWSSPRYASHKKSRSEPLKSAEATPTSAKRLHGLSYFSIPSQDGSTPGIVAVRRRRSLNDLGHESKAAKSPPSPGKIKRRRSWPFMNAAMISVPVLRGFRSNPPATIGPKLGHFRSARSTDSPSATSPVTPSSSRHSLPRDSKPLTPRASGEAHRAPRELKLATKQFSARSSMDSPVTTPLLHSETKRLSAEKPPSVPEEPATAGAEMSTPAIDTAVSTTATDAPALDDSSIPASNEILTSAPTDSLTSEPADSLPSQPVAQSSQEDASTASDSNKPIEDAHEQVSTSSDAATTTTAVAIGASAAVAAVGTAGAVAATTRSKAAEVDEEQMPAPTVQKQDFVSERVEPHPKSLAAVAATTEEPILPPESEPTQETTVPNTTSHSINARQRQASITDNSVTSSSRLSEETAAPSKLAGLPRLSTQSAGSRWSNQSGNSERPYTSRFVEGSPIVDKEPDMQQMPTSSPPSRSSLKPESVTSEPVISDIPTRTMSKRNYVDLDAAERASVQRLSTSSSVRLSKAADQLRTRDPSSSSFAGRVREGADSRQSYTSSIAQSEAMERDFDDLISGAEPVKYTLTPRTLRNLESPSDTAGQTSLSQPLSAASVSSKAAPSNTAFSPAHASRSPPSSFSAHMAARDGNSTLAPIAEPKSLVPTAPAPLPNSGSSRSKPNTVGLPRDARTDTTSVREMSDFLRSTQPPAASRAPLASIGETKVNRYMSAPTSTRVSRRPSLTKLDEKRPSSNGKAEAGPVSNGYKKKLFEPREAVTRRSDHQELLSFLREGPPRGSSNNTRAAESLRSSDNRNSATTTFSHTDSVTSQSKLLGQGAHPKKQSRVKDLYSTDFVDEDDEDAILSGAFLDRSNHEESLIDFLKSTSPPADNAPPPLVVKDSHARSDRPQGTVRPDASAASRAKKGWFSRSSSRDRIVQQPSSGTNQISADPPMLPMPGQFGEDASSASLNSRGGATSTSSAAAPAVQRNPESRPYNYRKDSEDKKRSFWKRMGTAH